MLLFTLGQHSGWFHHGAGIPIPVLGRIRDILPAKRPLLPPKEGLQIWELLAALKHSSHPSTRACVLLGEGDKQLEKETLPWNETPAEKGRGICWMSTGTEPMWALEVIYL